MSGNATLEAHCGGCAGVMALRQAAGGSGQAGGAGAAGRFWYVCQVCGERTPERGSAHEADEDVVWVTLEQGRAWRSRGHRGGG